MKQITRALICTLVLCLCASLLSGCAAWTFVSELFSGRETSAVESAEPSLEPSEEPSEESAEPIEPAVTVTTGAASGDMGDTVLIPVEITADSHLVNADLYVRYDASRLRAIRQYDADADEDRWTMDGIWDGALWSAEPSDGTLHIMLATGGDGLTEEGALFTLMFEVLEELSEPALIEPTVAVCGVLGENSEDTDLAAQGQVAAVAGQVTEAPEESEE